MRPKRYGARLCEMFEVRIHGRGGQGVVTAAELLSVAAFDQGRTPGVPELRLRAHGAPVVAFCRIDDDAIRSHDPVDEPDALVVQDPTLLLWSTCSRRDGRRLVAGQHDAALDELGSRRLVSSP